MITRDDACVQAVTIIETPPIIVVGLVGYVITATGTAVVQHSLGPASQRRGAEAVLQELVRHCSYALGHGYPHCLSLCLCHYLAVRLVACPVQRMLPDRLCQQISVSLLLAE